MAFLNLEKVGRDFTLSGKEFHNFIVEGKKDLEHVWTTFSYIGYMYIGTTLIVCRNALKDINETWYASCIYRLSD
jgi:hypothetical protein